MPPSPDRHPRAPMTGGWTARAGGAASPALTLRPAPAEEPVERVADDDADTPAVARQIEIGDARWSLAVATHQRMTGTMVRPEDRESLVRMGRSMGLDAFASNLVIAVVQDQARRGRGPASGIDQLLMIERPTGPAVAARWRVIAGWVVATVALEAVILWMMWA